MATKQFAIGIATIFLALSPSLAQTTNPSDARKMPGATQRSGSGSGEVQPQGTTGPLDTTTGGAGASSPQGETPAGMQPRPQEPSERTGQGVPTEKKD